MCCAAKDDGDKKAGKLIKMNKDPVYLKIVDDVSDSARMFNMRWQNRLAKCVWIFFSLIIITQYTHK